MKHQSKIIFSTAAAFALLGATTAQAVPLNAAIVKSVSKFSVGGGVIDQRYIEKDERDMVPTSYLDKERGVIPALSLDLGLVSQSGWYSQLHFIYASGDTDYTGYLQSGINSFAPFKTKTENTMFEFSGNLGYLFPVTSRIAIAPKVELGHLRWERKMPGSYGFDNLYTYTRYGGGVEVLVAATDSLVFSAEGIYARQHGNVSSDLLDEGVGTTSYTRFSVGADYALTEHWHLSAKASRVAYHSKESNMNGAGYLEPKSKTTHTLAMASIGYSF